MTDYSMQSIALCQRILNVEDREPHNLHPLVVDGIMGRATRDALADVNADDVAQVLWRYRWLELDTNGDPNWALKLLNYGLDANVRSLEMKDGSLRPGVPGDFVPIGVCNHHTAGAVRDEANPQVAREGRPDVPGPLYNFLVGQSGDVHAITNGRCHNAGKVDSAVVRWAKEDVYIGQPKPGRGDISGNTLFYGVAMDHSGKSTQNVSGKAVNAMAAINRMFCDAWSWGSAHRCLGHKELTSRKPDPVFDMDIFRALVMKPRTTAVAPKNAFECPHCGKAVVAVKEGP